MARVLTKCPKSGASVPTGHHMTDTQFAAASAKYAFRCSACGEIHQWVRADAWVEVGHKGLAPAIR